jgi:hypothetical protein
VTRSIALDGLKPVESIDVELVEQMFVSKREILNLPQDARYALTRWLNAMAHLDPTQNGWIVRDRNVPVFRHLSRLLGI